MMRDDYTMDMGEPPQTMRDEDELLDWITPFARMMKSASKVCANCHLSECDPRCPDAEENALYECSACGEPILAGEKMFRIDLDVFCEGCASPDELAKFYSWDGWQYAGEE